MRTLGLGLALLVGATAPVLASPVTACAAAASGEPHAGLVIDTGARTTTYCVALDEVSVSGTHLIELASAQFGLDYRLGFGGRAICMLDGVGAQGEDCFGAYPNFWGYFHGDGGGGWTWASGSAADHAIGDGDLEAWVWGTGDSASTHGSPPGMMIEDVCGVAPSPTPDPSSSPPSPSPSPSASPSASPGEGQGGGDGAGNAGGAGDTTASSPPVSPAAASATPSLARSPVPPTPSPAAAAPTSASPEVVRAAAAAPPAAGGPPAGGVLALGAIALLGAGGWLKVRRRKGAP